VAGTVFVLVILLICQLLLWLVGLAAIFLLTKRNGQGLKSMSWSFRHGFTAEFFKPKGVRRIHK